MDSYLVMLYVTLQQETSLKNFFESQGWKFCKPDLSVLTNEVGPHTRVNGPVTVQTNANDLENKSQPSKDDASVNRSNPRCSRKRKGADLIPRGSENPKSSRWIVENLEILPPEETVVKDNESVIVRSNNEIQVNQVKILSSHLTESNHSDNGTENLEDSDDATVDAITENMVGINQDSKMVKLDVDGKHVKLDKVTDTEKSVTKPDGTEDLTLSEMMATCELLDPLTKTYSCTVCGAIIKRKFNLKRHLRSHLPNQIRCTICNQFFLSESDKDNHMASKHASPHICHMCGSTFHRSHDFSVHLAKHGGTAAGNTVSVMKCPVDTCLKTFYRKSMLSYHLNMHAGNKPFKCVHCEKEFYSEYTCKRHQLVCKGNSEKLDILECEYCDRVFSSKTSLVEHETLEHAHLIDGCDYDSKELPSKDLTYESKQEEDDSDREFSAPAVNNTSEPGTSSQDDVVDVTNEEDQCKTITTNNESVLELDEANIREMASSGNRNIMVQHLPSTSNQSIFICHSNTGGRTSGAPTFFKVVLNANNAKTTISSESISKHRSVAEDIDQNELEKVTDDVGDIASSFLTTDNFVTLSSALLSTSQSDGQSVVQYEPSNHDAT